MYFSEIRIRRGREPAVARSFLNAYTMHKLLSSLCPGSERGAEGRVLFRIDSISTSPGTSAAIGGGPRVLVVSPLPPDDDERLVICSKRFDPQLQAGDVLRFTLRANPIVSRRDANGRQSRHDVVMDLKRQLREGSGAGASLPSQAEMAQTAGAEWLLRRASRAGFRIPDELKEQLRVSNYAQHRRLKRVVGQGESRDLQLSTLDFDGVLVVTDSTRFVRVLFNGLGPAKGLGCGLLTVRRA